MSVCMFDDFKKTTLNRQIVICWTNINDLRECSSILGSPSPLCLCPSCPSATSEKHALDFVSMYFICCVVFKRFQCRLVIFSKYGRSAQMTMPARRSSKFCAERCAVLLPILCLSLICRVIPAHIEPLPDCQPGNQINTYPRSIGLIYHVNKYPRSSLFITSHRDISL